MKEIEELEQMIKDDTFTIIEIQNKLGEIAQYVYKLEEQNKSNEQKLTSKERELISKERELIECRYRNKTLSSMLYSVVD